MVWQGAEQCKYGEHGHWKLRGIGTEAQSRRRLHNAASHTHAPSASSDASGGRQVHKGTRANSQSPRGMCSRSPGPHPQFGRLEVKNQHATAPQHVPQAPAVPQKNGTDPMATCMTSFSVGKRRNRGACRTAIWRQTLAASARVRFAREPKQALPPRDWLPLPPLFSPSKRIVQEKCPCPTDAWRPCAKTSNIQPVGAGPSVHTRVASPFLVPDRPK